MRKHKLLNCLFLVMILFAPQTAQAYQWGEMEWHPLLNVNESYDSNITYVPNDEKSDFITALSPGLEGTYEGKNRFLYLKGAVHQKFYAQHDDFNNFSQDMSGLYKQDLSKFDRFSLKNAFTHADQATSFDEEFGRNSGRYDFYKNLLGLTYTHDFNSQFSTTLKYDNDYYDPHRDDLIRSMENTFGVQADYAVSSQTIPFWFYEYSNRSYDPGGHVSRNSTGLGAKHFLTEQLYLNGRVGADFIDPIGRDELVRPQYMIGITDQPNETTTYGATFSRQYEDSSYDQNLLNDWRFTLNWGKELTERLSGVLSAFTGGGKFEPDGAKERLDGVGLALNFEATRNTILSLGYAFQKKNSSDNTRDYDKNTVSLNWKIKF